MNLVMHGAMNRMACGVAEVVRSAVARGIAPIMGMASEVPAAARPRQVCAAPMSSASVAAAHVRGAAVAPAFTVVIRSCHREREETGERNSGENRMFHWQCSL
jgi:hypothetical protein